MTIDEAIFWTVDWLIGETVFGPEELARAQSLNLRLSDSILNVEVDRRICKALVMAGLPRTSSAHLLLALLAVRRSARSAPQGSTGARVHS
jgi:hypothetical protein